MSTENKTELQKFASKEERELVLKKLLNGATVHEIYAFMVDKGELFVLDLIKMALLPENYENLPAFNLETREFSDEEFKKHLSLFKLEIDFKKEGFSIQECSAMICENILNYAELAQSENIMGKDQLDNFFTLLLNCRIKTPVVFTSKQLALLQ